MIRPLDEPMGSVISSVGRVLPFSREQLFDLAADVERYPEFLKWWIEVTVLKREGNACYASQVVGLGPIRFPFASKAVLSRPERIDVTSTDPAFRKYQLSWRIEASSSGGCRIAVVAEFELASVFLQRLAAQVVPAGIEDVMATFEARAYALYAVPTPR
jgi:coenzyme Q-binding protein COQ10